MKMIWIAFFVLTFIGCTTGNKSSEFLKQIWGSSTQALEAARAEAISKTYYASYWDVVKGVSQVVKRKGYVTFKSDEVKGYLVLMGIKGSVNTTEVGVFFVEENDHQTRVEITSLSTNAKRIVSKNIFHGLDIIFGLTPPDPEPDSETLVEDMDK